MLSQQPPTLEYAPVDEECANDLSKKLERNLKRLFVKWRSAINPQLKTFFNRSVNTRVRKMLPIFEKLKHKSEITVVDLQSLGVESSEMKVVAKNNRKDSISYNENQEARETAEKFIEDEFKDLMKVHRITGFPINLPYSDMQFIGESVFATGVHKISSSSVTSSDSTPEFVLATYVHPYPSNVYSVWIYVAALNVL